MSVQLPLLPQGVGGAEAQALVLALNDRLRRISQALGPGAPGAPGAAGAAGAPGANATGAFRLDINEGQWEPGHTWAMGDMTTFGARHTYVRRVAGGDPAAVYTLLDRTGWTAYGSVGASPGLPAIVLDPASGTFWGQVDPPQSLWFDLGAAMTFSQVQWTAYSIYWPVAVEIFVSNDGIAWELILADSFTDPGGFTKLLKLAIPTQTKRWLKVTALTKDGTQGPLCSQFNLATPTVSAAPDVDTANWLALS